jgi:hypothetical protein
MTLAPDAYRCQNHPEREGIGVCVRCRRVVCAECSTKIDRMNFCTGCLAALTADPRRRQRAGDASPAAGAAAGIAALIAGYAALVGLFMLFGLLLATLLRPGL